MKAAVPDIGNVPSCCVLAAHVIGISIAQVGPIDQLWGVVAVLG